MLCDYFETSFTRKTYWGTSTLLQIGQIWMVPIRIIKNELHFYRNSVIGGGNLFKLNTVEFG